MIRSNFNKKIALSLIAFVLSLLLVACGSTESTTGSEVPRSEATATPVVDTDTDDTDTDDTDTDDIVAPTLDQIRWSLLHTIVGGDAWVPAPMGTDVHFQIEGKNITGDAGCNQMMGTVMYTADTITFDGLATTRMACDEERMLLETTMLDIFGQTTGYMLADGVLTLHNADNLPLAAFVAATEKHLFVASEQADCTGVGPQKCLLVKEMGEEEYSYFYDSIAGFTWEAGYEYHLLVSVIEVVDPFLADASSLRYTLIDIIEQTAVAMDTNEAPLVATTWEWVYFEGGNGDRIEVTDPAKYTLTLMADGTYALQVDCNRGSGNYTVEGSSLTLEPGPMTMAMCDAESLDSTFLKNLGDVVTFVMTDDGHLALNLMMDAGNMVFAPAK